MSTNLTAEFPEEHPAARSARVRRDAADRARRWRETQREISETDAALARALLLEIGAVTTADRRLVAKERRLDVAHVVSRAAYILGGCPRFKQAKERVFARLMDLAPPAEV